jgi:cadmium resistance transport/sequestration family protein
MLAVMVSAAVAFAMTNLDDILLLALFFSQVDGALRKRHIVAGQYLGFGVLVGLSLLGFVGALVIPRHWIGLLGLAPLLLGLRKLFMARPNSPDPPVGIEPRSRSTRFSDLMSAQTYSVAAVTIANGGDNISVYAPLFASQDAGGLAMMLAVFFVLVGVWCYAGYRLARYPAVGRLLVRYGERALPYVFIGLGVYILIESGALAGWSR